MDIHAVLAKLAEEHLNDMSRVPWESYAASIRERAPYPAGDTFGCTIDDVYFGIGDEQVWARAPEGDIMLTAFAETQAPGEQRAERSSIIARPIQTDLFRSARQGGEGLKRSTIILTVISVTVWVYLFFAGLRLASSLRGFGLTDFASTIAPFLMPLVGVVLSAFFVPWLMTRGKPETALVLAVFSLIASIIVAVVSGVARGG